MSIELTRISASSRISITARQPLSDRLLDRTGTIHERDKQDQLLDSMDLEREAGSPSRRIRLRCGTPRIRKGVSAQPLDTPGHVDFAYEVSRSLAACEGALLIVDAAQGVEAQTVANVHLAHKQGLTLCL
jgi:GTP-binding protein LepA